MMWNIHFYVQFVLLNLVTGQSNDVGNSLAATYDGYTVVESTTSIGTLMSPLIYSYSIQDNFSLSSISFFVVCILVYSP